MVKDALIAQQHSLQGKLLRLMVDAVRYEEADMQCRLHKVLGELFPVWHTVLISQRHSLAEADSSCGALKTGPANHGQCHTYDGQRHSQHQTLAGLMADAVPCKRQSSLHTLLRKKLSSSQRGTALLKQTVVVVPCKRADYHSGMSSAGNSDTRNTRLPKHSLLKLVANAEALPTGLLGTCRRQTTAE